MTALSTLGIVHTAIALVAVGAGIRAFIRYREIAPRTGAGTLYIAATVATCVTGFFIFAHGKPTAAHALGVLTLLVLGLAPAAGRAAWLGEHAGPVQAVLYSLTFYFHFIPGVTETGIRLPVGDPLFSGHQDPALTLTVGLLFVVYVAGAAAQVRWLRQHRITRATSARRLPVG